MSTKLSLESRRKFALIIVSLAGAAWLSSTAMAQRLNVTLTPLPESRRLIVEGSCAPTANWSFVDSYAGMVGLGNRIDHFVGFDEEGREVPARKIAPGQFEVNPPATRFRYEVNLAPPGRAAESAMVSWLTSERGLLILADLLPVGSRGIRVHITLPPAWTVASALAQTAAVEFVVTDPGRAVFAVGNHLRTSQMSEQGLTFMLIADGDWAFADREALELAGRVLKAHREVFGGTPANGATLILFPFPQNAAANQWSAETKGANVTLLMGKLPSKVGALAQLSTPLTHELLHLWVPNGLVLEGDYDWFYEGFTVYQAASIAVRLELLTFPEFLNAIARATDAANSETNSVSLIEASRKRWTTGQASVYSKSMLVAFLYDLRVRSASHGKKSLDDVYRAIFQRYSNGARGNIDGNEAATQALGFDAVSEKFVRQFIQNPVTIDLASELAPFGFQVETVGLRTRITVKDNVSKQQRDLLRKLGYNDTVRVPRR
jgi:predicted metalloprotease with PDZ domain